MLGMVLNERHFSVDKVSCMIKWKHGFNLLYHNFLCIIFITEQVFYKKTIKMLIDSY